MVGKESVAYMFPGQGIQKVGMNRELLDLRIGVVEDMYKRANELLRDEFGWRKDLSELTLNGPQEDLGQTEIAQPALFVASATRFAAWAGERELPASVTGHSLGEVAALYAAGSFDYLDGVSLVAKRGKLMALAGTLKQGGMAVVNLAEDQAEALCARVRGDRKDTIIVPANINGPHQTIISGDTEAIEKAEALAQEFHAKIKKLPVSIAAHSPLMESAKEGMSAALAAIMIQSPRMTLYSPTSSNIMENSDQIREAIVAQLTGRVTWMQTVLTMRERGITAFIEVGPGEVLTNLVRKIDGGYHKGRIDSGTFTFHVTFYQHTQE